MSLMRKVLTPALALTLGLGVGVAGPAEAHTTRTVGTYRMTVGWRTEPAYVGIQNAVQLFVHDAKGDAVDDIGNALRVVVVIGSRQSPPLALEPSFDPDTGLGTHGEFDTPIIPTQPGDYTFHFTGAINGQPIDQSFSSGPDTFDTVTAPTAIEFPSQDPTAGQLAASVNRINPRVASAAGAAHDARDSSHTALILAVVALALALGLGGAGLGVELGAHRKTR
jgi:hypothetical protein